MHLSNRTGRSAVPQTDLRTLFLSEFQRESQGRLRRLIARLDDTEPADFAACGADLNAVKGDACMLILPCIAQTADLIESTFDQLHACSLSWSQALRHNILARLHRLCESIAELLPETAPVSHGQELSATIEPHEAGRRLWAIIDGDLRNLQRLDGCAIFERLQKLIGDLLALQSHTDRIERRPAGQLLHHASFELERLTPAACTCIDPTQMHRLIVAIDALLTLVANLLDGTADQTQPTPCLANCSAHHLASLIDQLLAQERSHQDN